MGREEQLIDNEWMGYAFYCWKSMKLTPLSLSMNQFYMKQISLLIKSVCK